MQSKASALSSTSGQLDADEIVAKLGKLPNIRWIKKEEPLQAIACYAFQTFSVGALGVDVSFANVVKYAYDFLYNLLTPKPLSRSGASIAHHFF